MSQVVNNLVNLKRQTPINFGGKQIVRVDNPVKPTPAADCFAPSATLKFGQNNTELNQKQLLFHALFQKDYEKVFALMQDGVDFTSSFEGIPNGPVHFEVSPGDTISFDGIPAPADYKAVPLYFLVDEDNPEKLEKALALAELMLINGVDANTEGSRCGFTNGSGNPLMFVKHPTFVNMLVAHGGDLLAQDKNDENALMKADNKAVAECILNLAESKGIKQSLMSQRDRFGQQALLLFILKSDLDMFDLMLEHNADIHAIAEDGTDALMAVCSPTYPVNMFSMKEIQRLDEIRAEMLTKLLVNGADPTRESNDPVDEYATGNLDALKQLASSPFIKTFKILMAYLESTGQLETVINRPDSTGVTPLSAAIDAGNATMVEMLIEAGAKTDQLMGTTKYSKGKNLIYHSFKTIERGRNDNRYHKICALGGLRTALTLLRNGVDFNTGEGLRFWDNVVKQEGFGFIVDELTELGFDTKSALQSLRQSSFHGSFKYEILPNLVECNMLEDFKFWENELSKSEKFKDIDYSQLFVKAAHSDSESVFQYLMFEKDIPDDLQGEVLKQLTIEKDLVKDVPLNMVELLLMSSSVSQQVVQEVFEQFMEDVGDHVSQMFDQMDIVINNPEEEQREIDLLNYMWQVQQEPDELDVQLLNDRINQAAKEKFGLKQAEELEKVTKIINLLIFFGAVPPQA